MTDHLFADAAATFGRLAALERQNADLKAQMEATLERADTEISEGQYQVNAVNDGGYTVGGQFGGFWFESLDKARAICNALNRVAARAAIARGTA